MQIDKDCKCTTEDNKELELVIVNALEKWENRKKEKDRENALLWQVIECLLAICMIIGLILWLRQLKIVEIRNEWYTIPEAQELCKTILFKEESGLYSEEYIEEVSQRYAEMSGSGYVYIFGLIFICILIWSSLKHTKKEAQEAIAIYLGIITSMLTLFQYIGKYH